MNAKSIEAELVRRQIQARIKALESEVESLNNDLKSVEAKNIELSRQRTAAESEVKELRKRISEEAEARAKESKELTRQVKSLTDSNTTLEKNLNAVVKTKDQSFTALEREVKRAEKALSDAKKEAKETTIQLSDAQKQVIEAKTGRVVPDGFKMTKVSDREIDVDFRYGPAPEKAGLVVTIQ